MNNDQSPESRARQARFAPFVLTLLCFLLPFVEVSCQGQKVIALTGFELVTGKTIEKKDSFTGQTQAQRFDSEPLVVAAFVCALAATVLCLVTGAAGKTMPALAGVAGLVLLFAEKSHFESDLAKQSSGLAACTWSIGFTAACGLLLVGTLVAGFQIFQASQQKPKEPAVAPSKVTF